MRRFGHGMTFATLGLLALSAASARADVELPVLTAPTPRVRVDGWLVEWPSAQFATVGAEPRGRLRFAMAPAERGIYLVASVDDDRLVRTERPAPGEDAIVVTIAVPGEGGAFVATDVTLYAGVADRTAASLTVAAVGGRPTTPRDAAIVEMPTASGYDVEAFVPWSALGGARDYARYRAMVRFDDVDQAGSTPRRVASVTASTPDVANLPRVVGSAGELLGLSLYLRDRSLRAGDVELEVRANFAGDATLERAFVANGELVVVGAAYAGGRDYHFARLAAERGAFADLRAVDVDGDGKSELFAVVQRADGEVRVTEARLFRFPGDRIQPMFRAELGLASGSNTYASTYQLDVPRSGAPSLRIHAATSTGVGARPPAHVPQPDAVALLTASTGIASRLYRFEAGAFGVVEETRAEAVAGAPSAVPATGSSSGGRTTTAAGGRGTTATGTRGNTSGTTPAGSGGATGAGASPTTAPTPTTRPAQGFDPSPLYEIVRRERDLPSSTQPRFLVQADLVEDARPESLCVLGKTLVLVGPGYRGGTGYFALDLGVTSAEDIRGLDARDITGDGKAEVWITMRQTMGGGPFWLDLLVVHRLDGNAMQPVFSAQIGLGDATREVRNEARVVGSGRSLQIALTPGQTRGFDARSFPFASTATPGMTSLLLPWRDRETRYRWNGQTVVGP